MYGIRRFDVLTDVYEEEHFDGLMRSYAITKENNTPTGKYITFEDFENYKLVQNAEIRALKEELNKYRNPVPKIRY